MRIGLTLTVALCACVHYVSGGFAVTHVEPNGHKIHYADSTLIGTPGFFHPDYSIGIDWPPLYGMVFRDPNNAAVVAEPMFQHILNGANLMTHIFITPVQKFLKKMYHDGPDRNRPEELHRCEIAGGNIDYLEIQHDVNNTIRIPHEVMEYKIKYLTARFGADYGFGILWFITFQKRWTFCNRVNPATHGTTYRQETALAALIGLARAPLPIANGTQALYQKKKSGKWCSEDWVTQFPVWHYLGLTCPDPPKLPYVTTKPYHVALDWSAMHRDKMVIHGNGTYGTTTGYYLDDQACTIPNGALTNEACKPLGLPLRNLFDAEGNRVPKAKEWAFNNGMMIARSTYEIRYGLNSGREIGDITNDDHSFLFASERLSLLNFAFGPFYCNEFGVPNEGGFGSFEEYILWESYAAKLFGGNRDDFGDTHAAVPGTCTNSKTWETVAKVWMTGRKGSVAFDMKFKGPLGHEIQLAYTRAFKVLNAWKFIRVYVELPLAAKLAPLKALNKMINTFLFVSFIWGRVYRMPIRHQMRSDAF